MKSAVLAVLSGVLILGAAGAEVSAQVPDSATEICALLPGEEVATELTALDVDGEPFDLSTALAEKPSLIIFFRGAW